MQETQVQSLSWEDSPGGGDGNALQSSCLGNPMERGAWRAAVHGVAESPTRLSAAQQHGCFRAQVQSWARKMGTEWCTNPKYLSPIPLQEKKSTDPAFRRDQQQTILQKIHDQVYVLGWVRSCKDKSLNEHSLAKLVFRKLHEGLPWRSSG